MLVVSLRALGTFNAKQINKICRGGLMRSTYLSHEVLRPLRRSQFNFVSYLLFKVQYYGRPTLKLYMPIGFLTNGNGANCNDLHCNLVLDL